jgi:hypothetical protein
MAAERAAAATLDACAAWAASLDGLAAILRDGVNLAVWPRAPGAALGAAVERLAGTAAVGLDGVVGRGGAGALLRAALPPGPAAERLADDAAQLADRFLDLTRCRAVRLRLETLDRDGCRLFHVDACPLRLLVTYAGPGTEWVANADARRAELTLQGRSFDDANRAIVPDDGAIRRLEPWWVAVQKGEGYPGNAGNALVHRSPPIAGQGLRRLRLCLDPAEGA